MGLWKNVHSRVYRFYITFYFIIIREICKERLRKGINCAAEHETVRTQNEQSMMHYNCFRLARNVKGELSDGNLDIRFFKLVLWDSIRFHIRDSSNSMHTWRGGVNCEKGWTYETSSSVYKSKTKIYPTEKETVYQFTSTIFDSQKPLTPK